jgi:hypothetical protein
MINTPSIHIGKDKITIIGDPLNLEALGNALLLKAKIGKNLSCVITDGVNLPIEILSSDDLL